MAVVNPDGLIGAVKGKLKGGVFQFNQGGNIIRANKSTHRTTLHGINNAINYLPAITSAWKGLTPAERATWYTNPTDFTSNTKFGDQRPTNGYNLFVQLNTRLASIQQPLIPTIPASTAPPQVIGTVFTTCSTSLLAITTPNLTGYSCVLIILCTPFMSPGRQVPIGYWRRIYTNIPSLMTTVNFTFEYQNNFGQIPYNLQLNLKVYTLDYTTGVISKEIVLSAISTV